MFKTRYKEAGCDRLSKPAAEVIRKTRNHPPVHREGGRIYAVVRRTGERGVGEIKDKEVLDQDLWGRDHRGETSSTGTPPCPPTKFSSTTGGGTVMERDTRPRDLRRADLGRPARNWLDTVGDRRSVKLQYH